MNRNEEFEKKLTLVRSKMDNHEYSSAKELCESMLAGDLRYRCDVAEFWILYASAEKVCLLYYK